MGADRGQGVDAGRRPLDDQAQHVERDGRDDRHPQRHAQGIVRLGQAAADIAECPAEAAEDGQQHRDQHGQGIAAEAFSPDTIDGDRHHPRDGHADAEDLQQRHPLTQQHHTEDDGERSRGLQHQRRQAGGHAQMHREKQERELQHAETHAVQQEPLEVHLRETDEGDHRNGHHREPQGGEKERREMIEAVADGNEVQTPQHHHTESQHPVAVRHAAIVTAQ